MQQLAFLGLVPLLGLVAAAPIGFQPVIIGKTGAVLDACGSFGSVRGLKAGGDSFVSVRASPSTGAKELDRLKEARGVIMCDVSLDGKWIGIIYPRAEDPLNHCGVTTPVKRPIPYKGQCKSGWVFGRYIENSAG
jgi:hypothetical protein